MYLEGIEKGKAFTEKEVPQIEAKDCLFLPFTTVVRDDQSVTVVNMDPVMHDIQAYETSNLGARVLFNVPLPMNPQHPRNFKDRSEAGMYHKHMAGPPMKELVNLSKVSMPTWRAGGWPSPIPTLPRRTSKADSP